MYHHSSYAPRSTVVGGGKYSFGRGLRKFGQAVHGYSRSLGLADLRRQASDMARAKASERLSEMGGQGAYARTGLVSGRGMYVDNSSRRLAKGQYHGPNYSSFKSAKADDGAVTVSNQEFFQYLYAPTAIGAVGSETIPYSSVAVAVQPGTMCPLLAQMACNFERYEFKQCMFHFETSLDGAALQSNTGQVGDVMMVSHMDVTSPDYTNSSEFEHNSSHVVSARVTSGLTCGVECSPTQMRGLTNAGINLIRTNDTGIEPGGSTDLAKFDQARVQIALNNLNPALAGRCLGRIYISYTVKLIKQRLYSAIARTQRRDEYAFRTTLPFDTTFTGEGSSSKAANAAFQYFVKPDSVAVAGCSLTGTKEPWSNLGTSIQALSLTSDYSSNHYDLDAKHGQVETVAAPFPASFGGDSTSEAIRIVFDDNTSGLHKVSLKCWNQSKILDPSDGVFPQVQVPLVHKLTTNGNGRLVTYRDRIATDSKTTLNEANAGAAGDLTTPFNDQVDIYGNAFVCANMPSNFVLPGVSPDSCMMGTAEFYIRLAPATGNVRNFVDVIFNGMCGSIHDAASANTRNSNQIMQSTIVIEMVNDHERLAPKTYSAITA